MFKMQIYRENLPKSIEIMSPLPRCGGGGFIQNTDVKGSDELRFGKDLSGDFFFRWELHSYLPGGEGYSGAAPQW